MIEALGLDPDRVKTIRFNTSTRNYHFEMSSGIARVYSQEMIHQLIC